MIATPSKDAARWQAGTGVVNKIKTTNSMSIRPLDCGVIYAFRSALVSIPARAIMQVAGADLFASRAERVLAKMILSDRWDVPAALTNQERAQLVRLADAVGRCTNPDGHDSWAVYLVRLQAERRHGAMLAEELRWAADRIGDGFPLPWVRRQVDRAFGIAAGELPLDTHDEDTGEAGGVAA